MPEEEKTEEKKEGNKKKNNILIIVAIIILVLCGIYYFYTNQKIMSSSGNTPITSVPSSQDSTLISKKWTWLRSDMMGDITTTPSQEGAFTATFQPDGRVVFTTDCNNGNAGYVTGADNSLTITPIASTMMFCEGSAETAYFKQIQTAERYKIENNQLSIMLQGDAGTMVFE